MNTLKKILYERKKLSDSEMFNKVMQSHIGYVYEIDYKNILSYKFDKKNSLIYWEITYKNGKKEYSYELGGETYFRKLTDAEEDLAEYLENI